TRLKARFLIGNSNFFLGNFEDAISDYRSIVIASIRKNILNRKVLISRYNLANLLYENGQTDSAIFYIRFKRDLKQEEIFLDHDLINAYLAMAEICISGDDHLFAEQLLLKSYKFSIAIGSNDLIKESIAGLHYLETKKENWTKADYYNAKLDQINDSLKLLNKSNELSSLQTKFEYELMQHNLEKNDILINQQRSILLIIAVSLITILSISLVLFKQKNKLEKLRKQLENNLIELEGRNLQNQMNPHFIFNSLNSVNNIILKGDRFEASSYLTRFSKLTRKILNLSGQSLITLDEELETLELYLNLEKLRLKEKLGFNIENKIATKQQIFIPPLIIQPFVENSIWHGILNNENSSGSVEIILAEKNDKILITIADDGIGRKASAQMKKDRGSDSKGSAISMERMNILSSLYNEDFIINYEDKENGTTVNIEIPKTIKNERGN
ncbi:MAG: histidine kinase, partial [Flavobacteriales bacterium]|nr:histidine kinase [Flavobacteriales bacterium]